MKAVFFFSAFAMHILMIFLVLERYNVEKMSDEVEVLRRELEAA